MHNQNGLRKAIYWMLEIMTETMGPKSISDAKKFEIVQKANEIENLKDMDEVYEVQPQQVRHWRAQVQQIIGKLSINRKEKDCSLEKQCALPFVGHKSATIHFPFLNVTVPIVVSSRSFRATLRVFSHACICTFTFGIFDRLLLRYVMFRFRLHECTSLCLLHSKHFSFSR